MPRATRRYIPASTPARNAYPPTSAYAVRSALVTAGLARDVAAPDDHRGAVVVRTLPPVAQRVADAERQVRHPPLLGQPLPERAGGAQVVGEPIGTEHNDRRRLQRGDLDVLLLLVRHGRRHQVQRPALVR